MTGFNSRALISNSAGSVSGSYLLTIALVAGVGIAGFGSLGNGMGTAIDGGADGAGVAVTVVGQAGAGAAPSASGASWAGSGAAASVSVQAAVVGDSGAAGATGATGAEAPRDESLSACGWNPLCYPARAWAGFADAVSDRFGDVPWLGTSLRANGGYFDGVWDGVFEAVRGVAVAVKSVGWDFIVEDVIAGTFAGSAGVVCKVVTLGNACQDSSWNPIKSTTDSVWNFVRNIPNARHAVGDAVRNLSLCTNPWNGQAAEDRGHACGETVVVIADLLVGAKGAGKVGRVGRRGGGAVDDAVEIAGRSADEASDAGRSGRAGDGPTAGDSGRAGDGPTAGDSGRAGDGPAAGDSGRAGDGPNAGGSGQADEGSAGPAGTAPGGAGAPRDLTPAARHADEAARDAEINVPARTPSSPGVIAQRTEQYANNCHRGTCSPAAFRSSLSGAVDGYGVRVHVMRWPDGTGHAVTSLVNANGTVSYLSWGRVFTSLDDIAKGAGLPPGTAALTYALEGSYTVDGYIAYTEVHGWDATTLVLEE
jgi:hypothetical protein